MDQIQKTISDFLKKHHLNEQAKVDVFFVSKAKIRNLNKKYRNIDKPTDVLSFPVWNFLDEIPKEGIISLGDIFICKEMVQGEIKREIPNLVIHSLNHLIGKHH